MLDQNKIQNGFECLMVSAKLDERAISIGRKVVKTKEKIGFEMQKELIETLAKMIPE